MKRTAFVAVAAFLFLWTTPVFAQETVDVVNPEVVVTDVTIVPAVEEPAVVDVTTPAPVVAPVEEEAAVAGEAPPPPPTEPMPVTPAELGETIDKAILAAEGGHWTVLAGFLIMILIWVLRRFGVFASLSKSLPWISMVVGGIAVFASYLASGYPVGMAILYAFFSGGGAIAMWETVFKHVDKQIPKATPATPETPAS